MSAASSGGTAWHYFAMWAFFVVGLLLGIFIGWQT